MAEIYIADRRFDQAIKSDPNRHPPHFEKPDYGIDAPDIVHNLTVKGGMSIILGTGFYFLLKSRCSRLAVILLNLGLWGGGLFLGFRSWMVWTSRVSKRRIYEQMINSIPWRGDEAVLDVGCGRGLLLVSVAKQLTTGKAVGIDIWRSEDQSDNQPEITWRNARAEGVADRIEVKDSDARQLPFDDATFDVIVSSLTLHNIDGQAGREKALSEIIRVLKPGGQLAIFDIRHTDEYIPMLYESGLQEVKRLKPDNRGYLFLPAYIVRGQKKPLG
jgi:arsenite methyltransferase